MQCSLVWEPLGYYGSAAFLHPTSQIWFLVPKDSHRRAGPYKNPNPGRGTNTGTSPVGSSLFLEIRMSIVTSNLVAWVTWSRSPGVHSICRPHPLALISGPPPARTWFALVCRGLRSAQPPRGLEPAGGSPWVLRLGRQLWSLLRLGPVAARGLCPTCAVCRLPAETLPFSPSLGADRFLGRYPLVTIVF